MNLVECVTGAATGASTVATIMAIIKRIGKIGVCVADMPGFVGMETTVLSVLHASVLIYVWLSLGMLSRALSFYLILFLYMPRYIWIGNRMIFIYVIESLLCLQDGIGDIAQIDDVMTEFGFKMVNEISCTVIAIFPAALNGAQWC